MKNRMISAMVCLIGFVSFSAQASLLSCDDAQDSSTFTRDDGFFATVCYGNNGTDFIIEGQGPAGIAEFLYNNTYGGSADTFTSVFEDNFVNQHFGLALPPTYVVLRNAFNDDGTFSFKGSVVSSLQIVGFLPARNGVTDTFMGGPLDTIFETSVTLDIVDRVVVEASTPATLSLLVLASVLFSRRAKRLTRA